MKPIKIGPVDVYLDGRDGWTGIYDRVDPGTEFIGHGTVYVCPVPFVVIRYRGHPGWAAVIAPVVAAAAFYLSVWCASGPTVDAWRIAAAVVAFLASVRAITIAAVANFLQVRRMMLARRQIAMAHGCSARHCPYCCNPWTRG